MSINPSDRDLFDRVVITAEKYVDTSPSTEFGPLVISAVAGAALREVSEQRAQIPKSVRWIMMSCMSLDSTSWRALPLAPADPMHGRPVSVVLPDFVTSSIRQICETQLNSKQFNPMLRSLVLSGSKTTILSLSTVDQIYFRPSTIRLTDPEPLTGTGWLVGSEGLLDVTAEAHVDFCLSQAERVIADRLFQGLGGYRPIASLLASIDDDFQHSLLTARSASGLAAILDSFRPVYSASSNRIQPGGEEEQHPAENDKPEQGQTLNLSGEQLQGIVEKRMAGKFGHLESDAIIKVSPSGDVSCRYGHWHGFVEFGLGFAGLRSKTVLFAVCTSSQSVQRTLARYFKILRQGAKNVELFILLANTEYASADEYSQNWQSVEGVYFGQLQ